MYIWDDALCTVHNAYEDEDTKYELDLVEVDNGEVIKVESQRFDDRALLIQSARETERDWNEQFVCKVWFACSSVNGAWHYDPELTAIANVIEYLDSEGHYQYGNIKGVLSHGDNKE